MSVLLSNWITGSVLHSPFTAWSVSVVAPAPLQCAAKRKSSERLNPKRLAEWRPCHDRVSSFLFGWIIHKLHTDQLVRCATVAKNGKVRAREPS